MPASRPPANVLLKLKLTMQRHGSSSSSRARQLTPRAVRPSSTSRIVLAFSVSKIFRHSLLPRSHHMPSSPHLVRVPVKGHTILSLLQPLPMQDSRNSTSQGKQMQRKMTPRQMPSDSARCQEARHRCTGLQPFGQELASTCLLEHAATRHSLRAQPGSCQLSGSIRSNSGRRWCCMWHLDRI